MLKVADISMLKKAIAKQFNVSSDELFVCDVWKSKIHQELKDRNMIAEINRRNDDIIIYHVPKPANLNLDKKEDTNSKDKDNKDKDKDKDKDSKDKDKTKGDEHNNSQSNKKAGNNNETEYDDYDTDYYSQAGRGGSSGGGGGGGSGTHRESGQTSDYKVFSVSLQTRVEVRTTFQVREENELIGMPFYVSFPLNRDISHKEVRTKIFEVAKAYLKDKNKWYGDDGKLRDYPCSFYAIYGYNTVLQLEDNDYSFVPFQERGLRFALHFPDRSDTMKRCVYAKNEHVTNLRRFR
ncbi:Peptidoglycan glycosyltransferase [Reticulomyxa filosa]|uniref:Peptidoglycan glycosyltransferase n=1 Tax=Reticulomyxa filosa TaxID=46433 RepID=X6MIP3_RETFI|nr:Peptidoglycan glycosyltransferase [Reticulomyxa filosa]|eukprot:ETO13312.1 Peptidoglycan glycosyltransferase [Reticulomyxa filosa]